MSSPRTRKRYQTRVFDIERDDDKRDYEEIKQSHLVDENGRYEIVDEATHWTKEGGCKVRMSFIESDDYGRDEPERY